MLYILNPSIYNRWVHIVGQTDRPPPSQHLQFFRKATEVFPVYPESSPGLPRHVTCSTGELTEVSPLALL